MASGMDFGYDIGGLRGYVEDLGVGGTEVLPSDVFVLAAGSALLNTEIISLPARHNDLTLYELRQSPRHDRALSAEFNSMRAYGTRVHELIGANDAEFLDSELMAVMRANHPSAPKEERCEFEEELATAFLIESTRHQFIGSIPDRSPLMIERDLSGQRLLLTETHTVKLPGTVGRMVEYGPGIVRGFRGILERGQKLWREVVLADNNTFTSAVNQQFANKYDPSVTRRIEVRSDGMAAASVDLRQRAVGRGRLFQLAVMSSVHMAPSSDIEQTLQNTYDIMEQGGLVVLRAPEDPDTPTPISRMIAMSTEVYGQPITIGDIQTASVQGQRLGKVAIFAKQ